MSTPSRNEPDGPRPSVDVTLVQMPYATVHHPSIALGLLKSYLRERRLTAEVVYGNILWAEELGLDTYLLVQESFVCDLLGEWTFAAAAFPDHDGDVEEYFALAQRSVRSPMAKVFQAVHPDLDVTSLIRLVRERADGFIDRTARTVVASGARIVACSSMFQQHCASLALLRRVKELAPQVVTMLGGANCEAEMGKANHRAFPWVDVVVSGEADSFFGDLCGTLLSRGADVPPESLPAGVLAPCHREEPAAGEAAAPAEVFQDLDRAAVPDYDDYFAALSRSPVERWVVPGLLVETSRGCWWGQKRHCAFCGLNGEAIAFRSKSPERVLAEFEELSSRYRIRRLEAVDNILDMRYFHSVLPRLAETPERCSLFFEVKPNLRREQLEQLVAAGVRWLQPGIESLDDNVLELMHKGGTGARNLQLLKWSRELGVQLAWGFLHGVPGERDEWYQAMAEWLPWICHLQPPSGFARIRYDRFSPYHLHPDRYGVRLSPLDAYRHVYPLDPELLERLAYFFEDYSDLGRGDLDPLRRGEPRPGLRAVARAIADWTPRFWSRQAAERPVLSWREERGAVVLRDTRPVAVAGEHRLEGLHRWVYLACDRALPPATLASQVAADSGQPAAEESIAPVLADLVGRRLVLEISGRAVSLGVREPLAEYPAAEDTPEGYVSCLDVIREHRGRSLANLTGRSSLERPVLELLA